MIAVLGNKKVGDTVLKDVAAVLSKQSRKGDILARMGGEEFMVVMPEITPGLASEIAERVRSATEAPNFTISDDGDAIPITVSIGFAVLQKSETVFAVVRRADEALYASKHGGRNRVTIADAA